MWVPPFRYLRISGYVLLPAAFRSLSRLSSALSAKASTLRSFLLNLASPFLSYIALYRRGPLRFALPVCFPQAGKFASFSLFLFISFFLRRMLSHAALGCLFFSFFLMLSIFGFQGTALICLTGLSAAGSRLLPVCSSFRPFPAHGLKWTRTTDLTLIRRAL